MDTAACQGTDRPSRARVRLSVRALMIDVLLVGGCLGWVAYRTRAEREAVAAVMSAGGSLSFDFQETPTGRWDTRIKDPPVGKSLLRHLPREWFQEPTCVVLRDRRLHETLLSRISVFERLEYLDLRNAPIEDTGLAQLRFDHMKHLFIDGTRVTDDTLRRLVRCRTLRNLDVRRTQVTEAGLAEFRKARPDVDVRP